MHLSGRKSGRLLACALCLAPALVGCKKSGPPEPAADRSDGKLPELTLPKVVAGAVTVDGKLDEAPWQKAAATGLFVRPGDGKPEPRSGVNASARLLWSDQRLYVGLTVYESSPSSPNDKQAVDPHIWEKASGIELMLQPGDFNDNRGYFEVQVDVSLAVWDTRFDDYNQPVGGGHFGHEAWSAKLERAVHVENGERYVVELALPWAALAGSRAKLPPVPGDSWRLNLYSFRNGQRDAMAWSPTLGRGNFHFAPRFGRIRFGS